MNYVHGETFGYAYGTESQDEAAAAHQIELDVLYSLGCKYDINTADMKQLCAVAQINFNELQNYSGVPACQT